MRKLCYACLVVIGVGGCSKVDGGDGGPSQLAGLQASGAIMGQHGMVRVSFSNPVPSDVDVSLVSDAPSVAMIPDHVTVPRGAVSADVEYMGIATGTVVFAATADGDVQVTSTRVVDELQVSPLSLSPLEVGAHGLVGPSVNIAVPDPVVINLSSSQASVATIDATVTIPAFSSSAIAQVTAVGRGASIITASANGVQASQTITVVDKARIDQLQGPSLLEVGGRGAVDVSLTAEVANTTQLMISSSAPSVVNVPPTYTIAAGSSHARIDVTAMGGGATTLTMTLNGVSNTLPITVLNKAQLEYVSITSTLAVGTATQLRAGFNVVVASPHDIALASSDPTVMAVPPTLTVFAGTSFASIPVTPLKAGAATITATFNGISRQTTVIVGTAASSLQLYGPDKVVVGTIGQLSVLTGSNVPMTANLVSSDPTVVSVPTQIVVSNYSEIVPLNVLKAGTATITATANGGTATLPVIALAKASITGFGQQFTLAPGSSANAAVEFDAVPPLGSMITFTTSNQSVAPAPAPVAVIENSKYVPVTITSGAVSGTAMLTATSNGTQSSAVMYVGGGTQNGVFQGLFSTYGILEVGAAVPVITSFSPPPPSGDTGTISFSVNGVLTTPSTSFSISSLYCCSSFPVTGAVAGTADVIVTVSGVTQFVTLNVVSTPTYTLFVPATIKAGASATARISTNAVVAANRTFTLSSSAAGIAQPLASSATLAPGGNLQVNFGVKGGAPGTATISATIGTTTLTANVTVN